MSESVNVRRGAWRCRTNARILLRGLRCACGGDSIRGAALHPRCLRRGRDTLPEQSPRRGFLREDDFAVQNIFSSSGELLFEEACDVHDVEHGGAPQGNFTWLNEVGYEKRLVLIGHLEV